MADTDLFLFVSHVAEDRSAALEIVDELERRGIPCWIAPRDVRAGRRSTTRSRTRSTAAARFS